MTVELQHLIDSKVGRLVKKLGKTDNKEVVERCTVLLKSWAKLVPVKSESPAKVAQPAQAKRAPDLVTASDTNQQAAAAATAVTTQPPADANRQLSDAGEPQSSSSQPSAGGESAKRKADSEASETPAKKVAKIASDASSSSATTADTTAQPVVHAASLGPVRDKAVALLTAALTLPDNGDGAAQGTTATAGSALPLSDSLSEFDAADFEQPPHVVARAVELALFEKHGGVVGKDYKIQLRSLKFNLTNKKNPGLRQTLVLGEVTPREFVDMKVQDMADPELVEQRRKDAEWSKKVAMGRAMNLAAPTNAFTCYKCGRSECRYIQLQTRSADEPMTTFINCVYCGNRWRN